MVTFSSDSQKSAHEVGDGSSEADAEGEVEELLEGEDDGLADGVDEAIGEPDEESEGDGDDVGVVEGRGQVQRNPFLVTVLHDFPALE